MIRVLSIFLITSMLTLAQYQKLDAPVNKEGRMLSFHLFHIEESKNKLQLHTKPSTLAQPLNQQTHLAAVAIGATPQGQAFSLEIHNGLLSISKAKNSQKGSIPIGPRLFSQQTPQPSLNNAQYARRTFLLHDGNKRWAIGYAPSISQAQLANALIHISTTGQVHYTSAYQLNAGAHSSLWIKNGNYHPLYLKELQQPIATLSVR